MSKALAAFLLLSFSAVFAEEAPRQIIPGIPKGTTLTTKRDIVIPSGSMDEEISVGSHQHDFSKIYIFAKEMSENNRLLPKGTVLTLDGRQLEGNVVVNGKKPEKSNAVVLKISDSQVDSIMIYCGEYTERYVMSRASWGDYYPKKSGYDYSDSLGKEKCLSKLKVVFDIKMPEPEKIK